MSYPTERLERAALDQGLTFQEFVFLRECPPANQNPVGLYGARVFRSGELHEGRRLSELGLVVFQRRGARSGVGSGYWRTATGSAVLASILSTARPSDGSETTKTGCTRSRKALPHDH